MRSGESTVSSSVKTAPVSPEDLKKQRAAEFLGGSPAKSSQPQPPKPNIMMRSVLELGGGKSFSERYEDSGFQKAMESIVPQDVKGSESGQYVSKFLAEAYRMMPESLDFITSPTGRGLIAAHSFPLTRPFAAATDYGLALYSGKQALDSAKAFSKDKSPENLARLATSLAGAYMGVKGGKTVEKAGEAKAA